MTKLDTETKRKLREMAAIPLLEALSAQDDTLTLGMSFEQRVSLVVDEAHTAFTHAKVEGLIRRAQLRYPNADLRRIDMLEERGLDRNVTAQLEPDRHRSIIPATGFQIRPYRQQHTSRI